MMLSEPVKLLQCEGGFVLKKVIKEISLSTSQIGKKGRSLLLELVVRLHYASFGGRVAILGYAKNLFSYTTTSWHRYMRYSYFDNDMAAQVMPMNKVGIKTSNIVAHIAL